MDLLQRCPSLTSLDLAGCESLDYDVTGAAAGQGEDDDALDLDADLDLDGKAARHEDDDGALELPTTHKQRFAELWRRRCDAGLVQLGRVDEFFADDTSRVILATDPVVARGGGRGASVGASASAEVMVDEQQQQQTETAVS